MCPRPLSSTTLAGLGLRLVPEDQKCYSLYVSRLDKAKEQIAYLKFWLGVMVVTDISLVGWLVSSVPGAAAQTVLAAVAAVVVITASSIAVHRRIERLIDAVEEL